MRSLRAIMFTDIEGYTALMQESEGKAVFIRGRHRSIFEQTTQAYGGQIIQYYGDGTLSVFASAVMAVRCAIEMQRQFQEAPVVPLRIGIHMGDVIITETDIIGNSVNLASRVESLGIAGSILISDKVFEEIGNQEDIKVADLGVFHFKNDAKQRTIYAIDVPGIVVPKRNQLQGKTIAPGYKNKPNQKGATTSPLSPIFQKRSLVLGGFLIILIFGVIGIWQSMANKSTPERTWSGRWQVAYYYESEPAIRYEGLLELSFQDSVSGTLEVRSPVSKRPEQLPLSGLALTDDGLRLRGEVAHTKYKIKGGYLRESLELHLEAPRRLTGRGHCMAFCAEGTEGVAIIWEGNKSE